MTPGLFVLIALCGGLGAVCRFVLDSTITARFGSKLPWGTMIINLSGSFVLGFLTGLADHSHLSESWLLVIGTGLLGGYTTFSTASFDNVRLLRSGRVMASAINTFGTLLGALLAAFGGFSLASML